MLNKWLINTKISKFNLAILVFGLFFLFFSRFWLLHKIPATLTHDELVYAIQADSFVEQGRTLDQTQSFFNLKPSHPMYAELPAQVMSLGFLLNSKPLLASHLTVAIMGASLPFLVAILVWLIFKNRSAAIFTWLVFVFSPLTWQMSRVSYDAFFSLWFYLVGSVIWLWQPNYRANSLNKLTPLLSIPFFFVGFFQYQGFKLILFPWLGLLSLVLYQSQIEQVCTNLTNWLQDKHKFKNLLPKPRFNWQIISKHLATYLTYLPQILVVILSALLTVFYAIVLLPQQSASVRTDSLVFTDQEYLTDAVNTERRLSLNSPWQKLASNKGTAIGQFVLNKWAGVFNPKLLLLAIEPNVSGFAVWTHGVFYWVEIALFVIGVGYLLTNKRYRYQAIILLVGIISLCLPALINSGSEWFLLRSLFSYHLMLIFTAWGAVCIWQQKNKVWLVGFALWYAICVANFSYQYWYRYPIISLDWGNFEERLIAHYVNLAEQADPNQKITIYTDEAEYYYFAYLLYNQLLTANTADHIAQVMQNNPVFSSQTTYTLGNISFTSTCFDPLIRQAYGTIKQNEVGINLVRVGHTECTPANELPAIDPKLLAPAISKPLAIAAVLDSGKKFDIYGDTICQTHASQFIHLQKLAQLDIENMAAQQFCSTWLQNPGLVSSN